MKSRSKVISRISSRYEPRIRFHPPWITSGKRNQRQTRVKRKKDMKKTIKSGATPMLLLLLAGALAGGAITSWAEGSHAEKVKEAITLMKGEAAKLGEPKAEGSSLFFGTTKMN